MFKNFQLCCVFLFLVFITSACDKKVDIQTEEKAISDVIEKYWKAWENLDLETLMSLKSHEPYSSIILLNNCFINPCRR